MGYNNSTRTILNVREGPTGATGRANEDTIAARHPLRGTDYVRSNITGFCVVARLRVFQQDNMQNYFYDVSWIGRFIHNDIDNAASCNERIAPLYATIMLQDI
jgi:hypothetical protein